MALITAAIIDAVSTDANALRLVYQLLAQGQQGVANDTDLKVTAGSGMQSVISAGKGLVNGTQNTVTQGAYGVTNDASITQTHSTADPTNPRNDLVGIKIEDAFYSGTNKQATAVIVTGTPAPSPADPTPPANWLGLARVRVNAGASTIGTITDLRARIGSPWHAEVYLAANQSIPAIGATIAWDTIEADPNGNFSVVNHQYTVPLTGRYLHTMSLNWNSMPSTAAYTADLYKVAGSLVKRLGNGVGGGVAAGVDATGAIVGRHTAGDVLYVSVGQTSGGALQVNGGQATSYWQITYLGPL